VRQAITEPDHTNRFAALDVKLGLTTPVSTAGPHVVVDVNRQPAQTPQDNSATCRTSLTPFAGHPVDVSYDRSSTAHTGTCRLHHRTSRSVRGRAWEEA
jgi:hypothetical protein